MRVLVAIDRSDIGESALAALSEWVQSSGADVCLLHVVHPREVHETAQASKYAHALTPAASYTGQMLPFSARSDKLAENRSQALARLREERRDFLRERVREHFPGGEHTTIVEMSEDIPHTIIEMAAQVQADFIAMATHGRGPLGQALLGSVAERVVREAPVPVLLVGPHMREAA